MTSFIDMLFMILIFYLVTCYSATVAFTERKMYIPTPKNELGRAQIVLQCIDENNMFWLDETASGIVTEVENEMSYLSTENLNKAIFDELLKRNMLTWNAVNDRLNDIVRQADQNPQATYFALIRVPNAMPYFRVADIISTFSNAQFQNIKYGCIAGTLDQLKRCKEIKTVLVEDKQGNRKKNLRIDF